MLPALKGFKKPHRSAMYRITSRNPWALTEETSFVTQVNDYRDTLNASGFHVTPERHRGAFELEFTQRMMARVAQGGPPALGLHLLTGELTKVMLSNVHAAIQEGVLEPVELFARAV
jgi:hypothetical protein